MMIRLFLLLVLISVPSAAFAITDEMNGEKTKTIQDYIKDYVDVPKGALDWKVLGKTKEVSIEGRDKDGLDFGFTKPNFPPEVLALDGKEVTLKGFMFPLDPAEAQHMFLFGPFPATCPFQYHVGPALVIEVTTPKDKPVKYTEEPITVTGKLELVKEDPDNSTFYRMKNVSVKD